MKQRKSRARSKDPGGARLRPSDARAIAWQIGISTFGILALELALIRWTSGQIRIFAYFNNLVLIGAFLGMGLGVALGPRRPYLVHWVLPVLCLLAIPLSLAEVFGLTMMPFPDSAVHLWGAERSGGGVFRFILTLGTFLGLFGMIVAVFVCAGAIVGHRFTKIQTLRAYSADLLGSLAGIVAVTVVSMFNASPVVWFVIGGLPFLWLSRRPSSILALGITLALAAYSGRGADYSPYNRIDLLQQPGGIRLSVNRDFHQFMHDLSDQSLANPDSAEQTRFLRDVYDLPFHVNSNRRSALVVGAGTGNDVQAALRNGYARVHSVDIDGQIIELGRRLHPERPYDDPRVVPVVNDARAFFEQHQGQPFDVICYGLLDSHAMFSSMSSLRLDNYVYTHEGIHAAWEHVSPQGHLAISFSIFGGPWIGDRLYWTIARATGQEPLAIYHGMNHGVTFIVARDPSHLDRKPIERYRRFAPAGPAIQTRITSDDWPFLYVRPGTFPLAYLIVLAAVLLLAAVSVPLAFGRKTFSAEFDLVLFLMGAGFLLIETRGVTSLSLLFGSTWLVNSAIFSSILLLIWLGNLAVQRFDLQNPTPWFVLLAISGFALWAFQPAWLNPYPLLVRGVAGGLMTALPVGFAGLIVPILLARAANPASALGSNLLGSVLGGCLEYLSMQVGLSTLVTLALLFYMLAFYWFLSGTRSVAASAHRSVSKEHTD